MFVYMQDLLFPLSPFSTPHPTHVSPINNRTPHPSQICFVFHILLLQAYLNAFGRFRDSGKRPLNSIDSSCSWKESVKYAVGKCYWTLWDHYKALLLDAQQIRNVVIDKVVLYCVKVNVVTVFFFILFQVSTTITTAGNTISICM